MPIMFHCACGKLMQAKEEYAGKRVRCGGCGAILTVPAETAVKAESVVPVAAAGPTEAAPSSAAPPGPPPLAASRERFQSGSPSAPPPRVRSPSGRTWQDDEDWASPSGPERPRRGMPLWGKLLILFGIIGVVAGGGILTFFLIRDSGRRAAERDAAEVRAHAANNMRQLLIAMHSHHDVHKHLPPAGFGFGKDKRLSWRVKILPYLEHDALYRKFRLDEPWDSPHNIKLLDEMPEIYRPLAGAPAKPGHTCYQVFSGNGLVFRPSPEHKAKLHGIADGTSNTILIVESSRPVPWTAPEDINYEPEFGGKASPPRPALGYQVPDMFLVGLADASVVWLPTTLDQTTLDRLIHPMDGMPIPDLHDPRFKGR